MIKAMTPLTDQQRQEIEREMFAGRKISAIKLYRKVTGTGLVEAKQAIEDMEVDLRRRSPENFISSGSKSGCLGVMACAASIVAVVVLFSFYILRS
jgi:hypothetical protein